MEDTFETSNPNHPPLARKGSKGKMNRRGSDCKATEAKIVVSGKMGVGKSALVVRYLTKRFIWEYDPTLESTYRHQITIEDDVMNMEILDTAGQLGEDSTNQWEGHVRWGDGFLLVYSVDDRESFENIAQLKNFLDDIKKPRNVSMVMMANKTDLERERVVSTDEGEKLAQNLACAYYEGSALLGDGVIGEAFEELCREVRRRKMMEGKQRRRSSSQQVKQAFNRVLTKIYS